MPEKLLSFVFNEKNKEKVQDIIKRYPANNKISAVMPLLHMAQEQNDGWLSMPAIQHVADIVDLPYSKVYELVTFYTMFYDKKIGKYHIKVCRTTPCWLCGSEELLSTIKKELNIDLGQTTNDELFTLNEVECLGACTEAPVAQINTEYHVKLDEEKIINIIKEIYAHEQNTEQQ